MFNFMDKDANYSSYKIGRGSFGTPRIEKWKINCGTLEIGNFCSIARNVTIFLGGDHHTEWVTTSVVSDYLGIRGYPQVRTDGNVIIGNDVWIGTEAFILSGLKIGDGAVIGARAVVAKDVPPYSVVVGNPARVVKKRFSEDIINKLLKIEWWKWDDEKIKENIHLIMSPNIEEFIKRHYKE